MLQFIHNNRRALVIVTFVLLIALSFSGVGLSALYDYGDARGTGYAVKVNSQEISLAEFAKMSRTSQQNPQLVVDRTISMTLLEQKAKALGLSAGAGAVAQQLDTELFRGNFDPALYQMFLQQIGMSAGEFEKTLKTEAIRSELTNLLGDVSTASPIEVQNRIKSDDAKRTVVAVRIDPATYLDKTIAPSEESISAFYNERATDFEVAAGVAYDYVLITPEQVTKEVPVADEDIELYYADNEGDFAIPEGIKARYIRLNYPKNSTEEQKAALKEKATKVHQRAKAGESFDKLALEFSDDNSTKNKGGDLGLITRGKMPLEFDALAFGLKGSGVPDLVETSAGFQVVKVEEYRAAGSESLEKVKGRITEILRKQEAPVYAANKAAELFELWHSSSKTLQDFAKEHKLTVASTNGVLTKDMDPESVAKGLTAAVLPLAAEPRQMAEAENAMALVQVTKSREADIAPLADVRERIVSSLRQSEARELARKEAQKTLALVADGTYGSLEDAASKMKLARESFKDVQRSKPQGILTDPGVAAEVFGDLTPNRKPTKVLEQGGKFILVQVTSIALPNQAEIDKKFPIYQQIESARIGGTLVESLVNQLKSSGEIEINPQVLASQG